MGLFDRFRRRNAGRKDIFQMVTERGNGLYMWNGKLYESDLVRACIKPRTKAIGKAVAKHIREERDKEGNRKLSVNPEVYMRFLLEEPNEFMTGQMLQEKVANQLSLNGNAFILILRDVNGMPVGLYPIPAVSVEAKYNAANELTLKFNYQNGKYSEFPYREIIHLREDYNSNDLFGDSPQKALTDLMNVVNSIDQSIINAIKNSAVVRWLLRYSASLRDEDLRVNAENFAKNYLEIADGTDIKVAATDAKAEATQITPHDYVPNAVQTDKLTQRVFAFFNTNEDIIHSHFTEDEWISYYGQIVEPVLVQMSNEYTRKLFSRRQRAWGNKIVFESSTLAFASLKTKFELVQFVDRGIMTLNEVREYLNLPTIEGGDVTLLRKDTGVVGGDNNDEDQSDGNDSTE